MPEHYDPRAWLFLGAEVPASGRDLGEVELGPYMLQRVAASDPALEGAVDPSWSLTELLLLRARKGTPTAPWECRAAEDFVAFFQEDVGAPGRLLRLAGEPMTVSSTFVDRAPSLDVNAWTAWLAAVRDERSIIVDPRVVAALREEHDLDFEEQGAERAELALARVKAKPEDLELLGSAVRERLGAELPADYVMFLRDVGALRLELVDDGGRGSLGTVLLPPKAVIQALDDGFVSAMRENGTGDYVPFFRFQDRHYALDLGADPARVVLLPDLERATHPSFAAWLGAWRAANLAASRIAPVACSAAGRLTTCAAFARCWARIARSARSLYEQGP